MSRFDNGRATARRTRRERPRRPLSTTLAPSRPVAPLAATGGGGGLLGQVANRLRGAAVNSSLQQQPATCGGDTGPGRSGVRWRSPSGEAGSCARCSRAGGSALGPLVAVPGRVARRGPCIAGRSGARSRRRPRPGRHGSGPPARCCGGDRGRGLQQRVSGDRHQVSALIRGRAGCSSGATRRRAQQRDAEEPWFAEGAGLLPGQVREVVQLRQGSGTACRGAPEPDRVGAARQNGGAGPTDQWPLVLCTDVMHVDPRPSRPAQPHVSAPSPAAAGRPTRAEARHVNGGTRSTCGTSSLPELMRRRRLVRRPAGGWRRGAWHRHARCG